MLHVYSMLKFTVIINSLSLLLYTISKDAITPLHHCRQCTSMMHTFTSLGNPEHNMSGQVLYSTVDIFLRATGYTRINMCHIHLRQALTLAIINRNLHSAQIHICEYIHASRLVSTLCICLMLRQSHVVM